MINKENTELILDELEFRVITSNIMAQIETPSASPHQTDFCGIIVSKYYTMLSEIQEDEVRGELRHEMIDFCGGVIKAIADKFDLWVNHTLDSDSVIPLMTTLYNFFILERSIHVYTFVESYILRNKDMIIKSLNLSDKKKDVTTLANKKRGLSKDTVCLLSAIQSVIEFIVVQDISVEEFFNLAMDGSKTFVDMNWYFQEDTVLGDFVSPYINTVITGYSDQSTASLRSKLITKLSLM